MEKHNRPIDDNAIDKLLREFLLDEKNIELTQNTIDMNAALVFNASNAVALPAKKEKILLNDREELLGSRRKKGGWWLSALLLLFFVSTIFFALFHHSTEKNVVAAQEKHSSSPANASLPFTDTSTATSQFQPVPAAVSNTNPLQQDSAPPVDSVLQKPEQHVDGGNPGRMHIPRSEERRVGKECRSRWSPY